MDTNIVISGIFFKGNPNKVLQIITAKEFCERFEM